MKKITTIAIALTIIIASLASCSSSKGGDLTSINNYVTPNYTVKVDTGTFTFAEGQGDTAIITKYSGLYEEHEVTIPKTIEFQGGTRIVTAIDDEAFYYCTSVTGVVIPDTVETIGNNAFTGCLKLASVNIPDAVTQIGNSAFMGCTALKSVNFSSASNLTQIGDYAFADCSELTSITLPSKLEKIGNSAFWQCKKITKVEMPEAVKSIGKMAYYLCTGLNTDGCIVLTAGIEEIGDFAFSSTNKEYIKAPVGSYAYGYVQAMIEKDFPEETESSDESESSEKSEG